MVYDYFTNITIDPTYIGSKPTWPPPARALLHTACPSICSRAATLAKSGCWEAKLPGNFGDVRDARDSENRRFIIHIDSPNAGLTGKIPSQSDSALHKISGSSGSWDLRNVWNGLLACAIRREFSGMIHWLSISIISIINNPTPSNPSSNPT